MLNNENDNFIYINGCILGLEPEEEQYTLMLSIDNHIRFQQIFQSLVIVDIQSTDLSSLEVMLDTLSGYASLTNASGISCSNTLSIEIIAIIEKSGVLDKDYS